MTASCPPTARPGALCASRHAGGGFASSFPYTSHCEGELSLRDNAEEITQRLSAEIQERVRAAGVTIIE
jgi:hypothetical protein